MIWLRSFLQFWPSIWSAYVERNDAYVSPEPDWHDGT